MGTTVGDLAMAQLDAMSIEDLWQATVADAGMDPAETLFLPCPGEHPNVEPKTWLRDSTINAQDDVAAIGDRLTEANSEPGRSARRFTIWPGIKGPEAIAGRDAT
jgi:hypothetical protein